MDEYEEEEFYTPARQLQKIDAVVVTLEFFRQIAAAVADTLGSGVALVAAHANYNVERRQFHEEAALEIETITGEQE
jgi:hypothetical protein